jgi:LacI family transcriptional regulator
MADELLALKGKSDGAAIVASDHPLVSAAIAELAEAGTPVIALVTDLTASLRRGYVGHDYWRVGRTAGWVVDRLAAAPGKVGVVIGSHRYLSQEAMEMGFRSYFRERRAGFEVLEPIANLENPALGCEATLELLARHPDLRGLYVAGGGVEGVFDALRDSRLPERFVTVCMALTEGSAAALQQDLIQVVLSHPYRALAEAAVDTLVTAVSRPEDPGLLQVLLPFDIVTAENL